MSKRHFLAIFVLAFLFSCKNYDEGFGGDAQVSGSIKHHSTLIPNAWVWIKFGSKELPGTDSTLFDAYGQADSTGNYSVTGLTPGNYYFYGSGWDPAIAQAVFGGLPVFIEDEDDALSINLAVTEGD